MGDCPEGRRPRSAGCHTDPTPHDVSGWPGPLGDCRSTQIDRLSPSPSVMTLFSYLALVTDGTRCSDRNKRTETERAESEVGPWRATKCMLMAPDDLHCAGLHDVLVHWARTSKSRKEKKENVTPRDSWVVRVFGLSPPEGIVRECIPTDPQRRVGPDHSGVLPQRVSGTCFDTCRRPSHDHLFFAQFVGSLLHRILLCGTYLSGLCLTGRCDSAAALRSSVDIRVPFSNLGFIHYEK